MITIQNQRFGIEIELTGISRPEGAKIISEYFGGTLIQNHLADGYDSSAALDRNGRKWKCMRDSSIRPETRGRRSAYGDLRCEVVSPILTYDDIEDLQEIVRRLRHAGAIANNSCGIHVHVDGANHDSSTLTRLINLTVGRQDLIYEALEIGDRANHWCKKINRDLLTAMKHDSAKTKESTERIWYSPANDGYRGGISHGHYNETRYHGVNLHAFFTKGTVEFRLFNGTTHAGKIKAYVQFCLAMSAWAINAKDNYCFRKVTENKGKAFEDLLTRRLKLTGKEYATCRQHLLAVFSSEEPVREAC